MAFLLPLPLSAAEGDAVLLSCLAEADDATRLACYDEFARSVERGATTTAAPTQTPAGVVVSTAPARAEPPDSVSGEISEVGRTARGQRVITLNTGHRWVEVEPGKHSIEPGTPVTVKKRPRRYVMRIDGMPDFAVRLLD